MTKSDRSDNDDVKRSPTLIRAVLISSRREDGGGKGQVGVMFTWRRGGGKEGQTTASKLYKTHQVISFHLN